MAKIDAPRIVFVLNSYTLGGMERQLASLIENRPVWAQAYDLRTITFEAPTSPDLEERFRAQGVANAPVVRPEHSFGGFFLQLYRTIRYLRPHIVHCMLDGSAGTWGRAAAVMARTPRIVQSDRSLKNGGTPLQQRIRPWLDRRTDLFLPNADEIRKRIVASGVPAERVHTIYSGVNLELFDPATDASTTRSHDAGLVLGFLGRFDRIKRIDVLIEALLALPKDQRPTRVLLAGIGPEVETIRNMVSDDAWLSDHCELIGRVSDVPSFLHKIDYLVLPSQMEGFPNAVLEAMAMAKPVVATRVSDVPVILDSVGILAEPGDVTSLADAIREMQTMRVPDRIAMGLRARQRVEERYDIRVQAERFWDLHKELLARPAT